MGRTLSSDIPFIGGDLSQGTQFSPLSSLCYARFTRSQFFEARVPTIHLVIAHGRAVLPYRAAIVQFILRMASSCWPYGVPMQFSGTSSSRLGASLECSDAEVNDDVFFHVDSRCFQLIKFLRRVVSLGPSIIIMRHLY